MKYLYVTLYKFEYFRYPFSYITLIGFDAAYINLSILVLRFLPRINGQDDVLSQSPTVNAINQFH